MKDVLALVSTARILGSKVDMPLSAIFAVAAGLVTRVYAAEPVTFYCALTKDDTNSYSWSTIGNGTGVVTAVQALPDLTEAGFALGGAGAAFGKYYTSSVIDDKMCVSEVLYMIDALNPQQHGFMNLVLPGWQCYSAAFVNVNPLTQRPVALIAGDTSPPAQQTVAFIGELNDDGSVHRVLADISGISNTMIFFGSQSAFDPYTGLYYFVALQRGGARDLLLMAVNTSVPLDDPASGQPLLSIDLGSGTDPSYLIDLDYSPVLAKACYPNCTGAVALLSNETEGQGAGLWLVQNIYGPLGSSPSSSASSYPGFWLPLYAFDPSFPYLPDQRLSYSMSFSKDGSTLYMLMWQVEGSDGSGRQVALTLGISPLGEVSQLGPITPLVPGEEDAMAVGLAVCPE